MIIKNINKYHLTNILKTISSDSSRKFGSSPRDDLNVISKKKKTISPQKRGSKVGFKTRGTINCNLGLMVPIFGPITQHSESDIKYFFTKMVDVHNSIIKDLGVVYGTKHYKAICLYCLLLCEGHNPQPVDRVSTGKVDKWPKVFGFLRPVYHSIVPTLGGKVQEPSIRVENLRLLKTLFNVNKVCTDYSGIDVSNLQQRFEISREWEDSFKEYLLDTMGEPQPLETNSFRIQGFLGNKRGPNGVSKIESAGMEAAKLLSSPLHKHFKMLCTITDNLPFYEYFLQHAEEFTTSNPNYDLNKVALRKLVAVPDKGNKSRTVAICDVWTQMLLEPFENVLKHKINREFHDKSAYFDHAEGFNKVNTLESRDDTISIDAEQWTDNFPSRIQYLVVNQRFGQQFAVAWQGLAITCNWNVGNSDEKIKYGKGQGMGTKGSFMAASYSDHHVIEYTYKTHYGQTLPYMKVGDDLVVTDPNNVFVDMYNKLGVPVNIAKTKGMAPSGHFLEFVSRNSWNGDDYSPISPNLVSKSLKQPFYIPTLVGHLKERLPNQKVPTLEAILDCSQEYANSKEKFEAHKVSTIQLMKTYNELSHTNIIDIESEVEVPNLDKLRLSIIKKILQLSASRVNLMSSGDDIETAMEHFNTFINDEYEDKWLYFIDQKFSLKEIELFNYYDQFHRMSQGISEEAMSEGHIYGDLVTGNLHGPMDQSYGLYPPYYSSDGIILSCLMEAKCKLEGVKIIYDLSSSSPKNSRPMVELLKSFKQCLKESLDNEFKTDLSPKEKYALSTLGLNRLYKSIQDRLQSCQDIG